MSNTIWLEPNVKDNLGHQINEIGRVIEKCGTTTSGDVIVDFKNVGFMNPTIILGISSLISIFNKKGRTIKFENICDDMQGYLNTIVFPNGIFPDLDTNWSEKLDSYKSKTYLPVINFPTGKDENNTFIRNSVLSKLNELLAEKLNLTLGQFGAVAYLISELTDNIVDHAGIRRGKILTQYFPSKEYIEVCIIDEGKTILGSYQESNQYFPDNDKIAISYATQGKSTKSPERGFGIPTSINLIVKGLNGKFCLLSGSAMLVNNPIIDFHPKWAGTLISIKIPKNFQNINYRDYV